MKPEYKHLKFVLIKQEGMSEKEANERVNNIIKIMDSNKINNKKKRGENNE